MTTMILVIIGILIAAAAALFVIFYGGDAFNDSTAEAEAATIISQSTQINAAFDLYKVEKGKNPGDENGNGAVQDLIDAEYLDGFPMRNSRNGYDSEWKVDYERGIARTTIGDADDVIADKVCRKARERFNLKGDPKSCSDPSITSTDPCCVMPAADL